MKNCKYCGYEMPNKDNVCPKCRKKQNKKYLEIIGYILILINFFSIISNVKNGIFTIPDECIPEDIITTLGFIAWLFGYLFLSIIGAILLYISRKNIKK